VVHPQTEEQAEESVETKNLAQEREELLGQEAGNKTVQSFHQATLLQMQQQYGNAYVQQVLNQPAVQRQEEADEDKDSETPAPEPYEFEADAAIRDGGKLDLDLQPAIDLYNFDFDPESTLPKHIKNWLGVGAVGLEGFAYNTPELKMTTDGRLSMNLGDGFLRHMAALITAESENGSGASNELEQKKALGKATIHVTASLHFSPQDPAIDKAKLKDKNKIVGNDNGQSGLFLLLKLESIDFTQSGRAITEELEGLLLFKAIFQA
jgi:hypothetical protein